MLAERYLRRRYYEGKQEGLEEGRKEARRQLVERLKNLPAEDRLEELNRFIEETLGKRNARRRSSSAETR